MYPNLWFDQENILGGDSYEREIGYGISNAQVFIPLLTPSIAEDLKAGKTDNYYNKEWRQAAERQGELTIVPLAAGGFSAREPYYKTFEHFFSRDISCIDNTDALLKAIDKHLNGHE